MPLGSTYETVSVRTVLDTGKNGSTGATVTLVHRALKEAALIRTEVR